jgi:hypothetical protein
VLGPRLPWTERAWLALQSLGLWAYQHVFALTIALFGAVVVVWKRRGILDWVFVRLWWSFSGRSWREVVFGCLRLIERRCRWQRRGRPHEQSLAAWAESLRQGGSEDEELAELVRLGEWAAYAPGLPAPLPPEDVRSVCRRALETWTLSRLDQRSWQGGRV